MKIKKKKNNRSYYKAAVVREDSPTYRDVPAQANRSD